MAWAVRWNETYTAAALLRDGSWCGGVTLEHWWASADDGPQAAWVAGHYDAEAEAYVRVCVELPARTVTADRDSEMAAKTEAAIVAGPPLVAGPAGHAPRARASSAVIHDQLDRVVAAWAQTLDELFAAAPKHSSETVDGLFVPLMHVLNWAYTADETLQAVWNGLPSAVQMVASRDADRKLADAIADRRARDLSWAPTADVVFKPYLERRTTRRPYRDWASVIVAGTFHAEFFAGLNWISGKLRHNLSDLPIELRQMTPGGEPRWKWKRADTIVAADQRREPGRSEYVDHLEGNDVLGLFSWLVDVFADAQRMLVDCAEQAEAGNV